MPVSQPSFDAFPVGHLVLAPVISVGPVALPAPGRGQDLHVRISAPLTGGDLPVLVFSHGFSASGDVYAPLTSYWAAQGFVVLAPTFLDSKTLRLPANDPRTPDIWKTRIDDVGRVLDHIGALEAVVPGLAGRIDRSRIVAVGHSFGAQTTAQLLGARTLNADGSLGEDRSDPRVSAGVLLSAAGRGGDDLSPLAKERFPYLNQTYAEMCRPTLIVAGDKDVSPLTVRGPDWFTDAYALSPGEKALVVLFGGEHMLGGIMLGGTAGVHVKETLDEDPARVAAVQRLTTAYLKSVLRAEDPAWASARLEFEGGANPIGRVETKRDASLRMRRTGDDNAR